MFSVTKGRFNGITRRLQLQPHLTVNESRSTGWNEADAPDCGGCEADALERIPKDVGWLLLGGGLLTEVGLPGVPPFWVFGLMIVWPRAGRSIGRTLRTRTPRLYQASTTWIDRYVHDLETRYPSIG